MSRPKMADLFQRGKHTISRVRGHRYHPLDFEGGYAFSAGIAYGQVNQVLDLAAKKPRKAAKLMPVAEQWLKIIAKLDEEGQAPSAPIGFYVNTSQREEEQDDSTESN